jgi:PAS domain S-box-containing protein
MREPVPAGTSAYLVAVLVTTAAVAARWSINPFLGDHLALVTLFPAVAAAAWYGGYRPAFVAAVLGYVACRYLFIEARAGAGNVVELLAFLFSCSILIGFAEAMRRARHRIGEGREVLRVTLASIGDAVVTTDIRGRVTYLNSVAESLTGWQQDEAVGQPLETVFRIVNEETREQVESPATRALREGLIVGLANHTVLITKDGSERPIDDSAAPIRDAEGRLTGCVLVFRDVTERRRADLALQRSERELVDFFENASVGLHWVGDDGTILRVNQAELDMLGYREEEYVGHRIAEFHVDQPAIEDILSRLKRGDAVREYPARMRGKDGSIRDVLINSSALFEDGTFVRTRCFTIDVTHRKQAEETQALLAAIVASSDDAIVGKTLEGVIVSWNTGAERLFGYSAAEATGQSINLIIPPDLQAEERSILARLRRGERIDHFETIRVSKDGRRIDISLTVSPVRDRSGRVIGASKVARDVTDRKRAEEALRESEEWCRQLANSIDQFAWTCDELGYATWYNQRWYDYTGTTFEEMEGEGWKKVLHPDHIDRVVQGVERAVATGEPWEDIFPLRGKGGTFRWFLSRSVPIRDERGRVIRWFGTNTDITQQRQLEESLREADRHKDEFLAMLAHELRNPLSPIRNAVQVLLVQEASEPQLQWALKVIDRQVQQMARLLDDLLDVSRISHNKLDLRKEPVELAAVVQSAIETSRPLIDDGGHGLTVDLPPDPVFLDADPVRLAQVFSNLLNNAAKYTDAGGHIRLTGQQQGSDVVISVRDDGIGISAEALPRIFDMFSQGNEATERSQGGLGIGLSLVRGLVELHGGSVEARSNGPRRGSEFVVRLPSLVQAAVAPPRTGDGNEVRATKRRLLIVDDRKDNADGLAMLLKMMGHEVQTAYDGEEAVVAAAQFKPEVVLLDIGMPGLDGYETCRHIRRQPGGKEVYLIALTGWGKTDDRRRTEEAGFDYHMVKPVDPDTLVKLLASLPSEQE